MRMPKFLFRLVPATITSVSMVPVIVPLELVSIPVSITFFSDSCLERTISKVLHVKFKKFLDNRFLINLVTKRQTCWPSFLKIAFIHVIYIILHQKLSKNQLKLVASAPVKFYFLISVPVSHISSSREVEKLVFSHVRRRWQKIFKNFF